MRKIWDIHGGVHPPENKSQSLAEPIGNIPLASEIILPLSQHIGEPALCCVNVGDKVLKGQEIASAQGVFSASIHASTSGTVTAIEDRPVPHPSGMNALCVIIKPDGNDTWIALQPCESPFALSHKELVTKVQRAGLAGMGGAGFPTSVKLNPRPTDTIKTLILNGTECEPYITADDALMQEKATEIAQGALLIAKVVGQPDDILIGVEDNKPKAIAALRKACAELSGEYTIQVIEFPTKYPSGGEKQLIQILTGKEVPSGKLPADIGVLVQNVGTAYAIWRAIRHGEPLIERVTTVVGKSLTHERNIWVPIGTPINHIIEQHGFVAERSSRLIIGGPMMGYAIEQAQIPVIKATNCILVPSKEEAPDPPPAQPCIRCGMCSEACPAQLLPQQLLWYAQAEDNDKLKSHNLFDCIECGACSYVCPSAIPLVQYYRAAKGRIRQEESEKQKSDHARLRFEHRKERMEKAEQLKEAKRLARKKAAEEAKIKLAQKKALTLEQSKTNERAENPVADDLVATAVARANINNDDPLVQRKKLARALSSAKSRSERVDKQIAEHSSDAVKIEKLKAQQKQALLKVKEAQEKLDRFDASSQDDIQDQRATPLEERLDQVSAKLEASPLKSQENAVAKIAKTLSIAKSKVDEAQKEGKPSVEALKLGVSKLEAKLEEAKQELAKLQESGNPQVTQAPKQDAAASAIAKAKEKAAEQANMSSEEKRQSQIESLEKRIDKARDKLEKAQQENSEHVALLSTSLEKLKDKLAELKN